MKYTIFKRLTFDYIAIILSVLFLGVYVTIKLKQLNGLTRSVATVDSASVIHIESLLDTMYSQVGFGKKYFISKDKDFYLRFKELKEYFLSDLNKLENLINSSEKYDLFLDAKGLYSEYLSLFEKELTFENENLSNSTKRLKDVRKKEELIVDTINRKLKNIITIARSDRDNKIEKSNQISLHILKVTAITSGLAVLIGILISFFNTRIINRSILVLQKRTEEISKGKFEKIENIESPPEIKELGDHFNLMCERLGELDDMKVDFISHISHELRTPLTAIKEASSMMLEEAFVNTNEKQQELFTVVKEECDRLITSVNKILDLSCMEAKMMDYQFKECSFFHVVQTAILKLAPIAQSKRINLELIPPPELPIVKIDSERIGQVFENLIGNALKFTPNGGIVTVKTSCKTDASSNKFLEVSISDTGCGILKDNLGKIFDKFKRIKNRRETVRGTGLGLSIVKHIIDAHGGSVWVKSEPGKGSSFFFSLPV